MKNMILKIQEREEAICGPVGLWWTTHTSSEGQWVDVDALHDQFPLRHITGKGSQIGSLGNKAPDGVKVFSWPFLARLEYLGIYRPIIRVRRPAGGPQARGATTPQGAPCRFVASQQLPCPLLQVCCVSSGPEKYLSGDFIPFGLRLIFLICNSKEWKKRNSQ